jgi:hypothetical protein
MSSLLSHERTQISQQNKDIEDALVDSLNGYLNVIRLILDESRAPWSDLRIVLEPKFRPIISQSIREAATLSYQLGSSYAADKSGLPFFLTTQDIANIKALTDEYTGKFFGRIQLALRPNMSIDPRVPRTEPANSSLNPNYIATSIAIGVTSRSLALGSILKAKALASDGLRGSILQAAKKKPKRKLSATEQALQDLQDELDDAIDAGDIDAIPDILASLGGSALIGIGVGTLLNLRWVWTAMPGACTQYCVPLNGQTFDVLDPNVPIPVQDSHENCKCRLLLM